MCLIESDTPLQHGCMQVVKCEVRSAKVIEVGFIEVEVRKKSTLSLKFNVYKGKCYLIMES